MNAPILQVRGLSVAFRVEGRRSVPVRNVSFDIPRAGRTALVGESGCGKSLTALAIGGLLENAEVSGEISGSPRISYIFQNPMQSLDPCMKVGRQIAEALPPGERRCAKRRIAELLAGVGLSPAAASTYPCRLSGGQQQRVMAAIAIAARPDLLVADEPTTALDVTTQKEVLDLICRVAADGGAAVLLITHNLGLVARYSDEVNVMYAGEIVESGPVAATLRRPRHPYTRGLLAAVPSLDAPPGTPLADIPGVVPSPLAWPSGCAFHPRCRFARQECSSPNFSSCPEMLPPKS